MTVVRAGSPAGHPGSQAGTPLYHIVGGADASRFTLDAQTGELRFLVAPDHEAPTDAGADNVYDLVVQASLGQQHANQALAVTVLNLNDNAPVIHSNGGGEHASLQLPEGLADITLVSATDADALPGPLTLAIVGGADAALFTLDPATGQLRFVQAPAHQPGGDNHYEVLISVSDGERVTRQWLAIEVTADDAPQPLPPAPPLPTDPPAPTPPGPPAASGDGDGDDGSPSRPGRPDRPAPALGRQAVDLAPPASGLPTEPQGLAPEAPAHPGSPPGPAHWAPQAALLPGLASNAPSPQARDDLLPSASLRGLMPLEVMTAGNPATADGAPPNLQAQPLTEAELNPELGLQDVAVVGSLAATAGALMWASRGTALVASLLISAPAWRSYDLLPVLRRRERQPADALPADAAHAPDAPPSPAPAQGTAAAEAALDRVAAEGATGGMTDGVAEKVADSVATEAASTEPDPGGTAPTEPTAPAPSALRP